MMIRKISSSLLFVLAFINVSGQSFDYKTDVSQVENEGYYRILLSQNLLGKLSNYQSDLRLFDSQGNQVPYAIYSDRVQQYITSFKEYEIIDKVDVADGISSLIFTNPELRAIDNVSMIVRNNAVEKRIRLSGSDDRVNWFAITDYYSLRSMASSDSTSELKILDFPLSNYKFFKLEIDNDDQLPIDLRALGYYDSKILESEKTTFDCPIEYQMDSLKSSFLKINFKESIYLEKMKFNIVSEEYYSRSCRISVKRIRDDRKGRAVEYFESIGYLNLESEGTNEVDLKGISENEFYIEIENEDNLPVVIKGITASMNNKYAIAKLKAGEEYSLHFGNSNVAKPRYDIQEFVRDLNINEENVSHGAIISLKTTSKEELNSDGFFDNPIVVWTIIIAVGLLFGGISISMVRSMNRKS